MLKQKQKVSLPKSPIKLLEDDKYVNLNIKAIVINIITEAIRNIFIINPSL